MEGSTRDGRKVRVGGVGGIDTGKEMHGPVLSLSQPRLVLKSKKAYIDFGRFHVESELSMVRRPPTLLPGRPLTHDDARDDIKGGIEGKLNGRWCLGDVPCWRQHGNGHPLLIREWRREGGANGAVDGVGRGARVKELKGDGDEEESGEQLEEESRSPSSTGAERGLIG